VVAMLAITVSLHTKVVGVALFIGDIVSGFGKNQGHDSNGGTGK